MSLNYVYYLDKYYCNYLSGDDMSNNPLQGFFRLSKLTTTVPSKLRWYDDSIIDTSSQDIDIRAMTAADEVTLKNPDQLLNGQAIVKVLKSCVPAVKDPSRLLSNDVDVLLTAIRAATFGNNIDIEGTCTNEECKHENTFGIDIPNLLDTIDYLDETYSIETRDGISIEIRPVVQKDTLELSKAQFEQSKMVRALGENPTEDMMVGLISRAFDTMMVSNVNLIVNCVHSITIPDGTKVTNKTHIREFLDNIESSVFNSIKNTIEKISKVGIRKVFTATCEKCEHEWEMEMDFNPIDFFTDS